MNDLKVGDVVQLKSGGPLMTIEGIGKYGYVEETQAKCKWFEGKKVIENTFCLTTIEKVEEE